MIRLCWIELRRSSATGLGLLVIAITVASLVPDVSLWQTQWTWLAEKQAQAVFVLLPIALAGGALLGRRDRRTRADELLSSTARPRPQRLSPALTALATALVLAHLLAFAAGSVLVAGQASYLSGMSLLVPLTDAPILVGSAWLGFAAGRAWTSLVLPPVLAVGTVALLVGLSVVQAPGQPSRLDNLLFPVQPPNYDWEVITGRALVGHLVLGAGFALAGFVLAVGRHWPIKLIAVPALVGALVGAAFIPGVGQAGRYAVDANAERLVCSDDGQFRVCVTVVHQKALVEAAPPVRRALEVLAKLPGSPRQAVEWRTATVYQPGGDDPAEVPAAGNAVFYLDHDTAQPAPHLFEDVVMGGGVANRGCRDEDGVAEAAIGAWLLGTPDITLDDTWTTGYGPGFYQSVGDAVRQLRALPAAEQRQRVIAVRDGIAACRTDLLPILTGKAKA